MVTIETCRNLALDFPDVVEQDHFGKPSFRINKKIFMTFHPDGNLAMIKLTELNQSIFTAAQPEIVYPVKGFWGRQGATMFDLAKVKKSLFASALKSAYENIASKKSSKTKIKKRKMKPKVYYANAKDALDKLKEHGYTTDFNLEENCIACLEGKFSPDDFEITAIYRYEGDSNPDDESTVYAIRSASGIKGVLVTSYGAYSDKLSNEILEKLKGN